MTNVQSKSVAAASMIAIAVLGLSACSSKTDTAKSSSASSTTTAATSSSAAPTSAKADPAANLVGSGCAGYAEKVPSGAGSVAGMAADPVTVAASNNPLLTTLTATVSGKYNPGVNLVDTLNGSAFTIIAPTDDAFAKLPAGTVDELIKPENKAKLTKILTTHVLAGKVMAHDVSGKKMEPHAVSGEALHVDGTHGVVVSGATVTKADIDCTNGVIHVIDTVILPKG